VALIGAQIQARFEFPPDAPGGIAERIGYFLIGGQSAASHNGRSSPRRLMEWIGRDRMRTMLRGRLQRRESCNLLNQGAGYSSEPSANLILSYTCPIDAVAHEPCGLWCASYRAIIPINEMAKR
jgi:hypothetical protein